MKLSQIEIKNFRSIKDVVIILDYNCLILLGKNEAGKSNILKAIAALFEQYKVSSKDKRKKIDNESINSFYIRGTILLSDDDINEIINRFSNKYKNTDSIIFAHNKSLFEYAKELLYELLIEITILDDAKPIFYKWELNTEEYALGNDYYLANNFITNAKNDDLLDLEDELFKIAQSYYIENKYNCHYWQYSDNYILPNSVNINDFINNPDKYKPLENIFALCNRGNIKKEFEDAQIQDGDYSNLLDQVSKEATSTFQQIWDDFKETSIQLIPNGDKILIKVVDKVKYSFEDRSDGFKKFICILLMLSTQSRANKIGENDIILIDEPDQSLYPSSARYLRDELLEISKKSKIIYSTHSQYMIDSSCLSRHILVEKDADITTLKKGDNLAPFSNDELLRRAIGTSIFECLQPKNIIFEGWLDKELFLKYCEYTGKNDLFKDFGKVYLSGISGVETLVQLLILANKKFIIVADSDNTSKNKKNDFINNYPEYQNSWLSYDVILEKTNEATLEDFINSKYIEDTIIALGLANYSFDKKVSAIKNIDKACNNDKTKKQEIKNMLISSINQSQINSTYGDYVAKLKEKLDEL